MEERKRKRETTRDKQREKEGGFQVTARISGGMDNMAFHFTDKLQDKLRSLSLERILPTPDPRH